MSEQGERTCVSYVYTLVVFHSRSDQTGRFERRIPESNDQAGTERTPHSPPGREIQEQRRFLTPSEDTGLEYSVDFFYRLDIVINHDV